MHVFFALFLTGSSYSVLVSINFIIPDGGRRCESRVSCQGHNTMIPPEAEDM